MIKHQWYLKTPGLICIFLMLFILTACNDEPVEQEIYEVEKGPDYYGSNTELLDVDSQLTLELLGEEKIVPADMVVIEDKLKILVPSELDIDIDKDSDSNFLKYDIDNYDSGKGGHFSIFLSLEGTSSLGTKALADIYHEAEYEVDSLANYYPATASKYDMLTNSTDDDYHRYYFTNTIEEENLFFTYYTLIKNEDASRELEALICAIAASIEILE